MAAFLVSAAGLYDLGFAAFHLAFWRLFAWPASLRGSGGLNAAITQTLNAMLAFVFVIYGVAMLLAPSPILAAAGAGFWLLRAVLQPVLFALPRRVSAALTALFAAGAALHGAAALIP